MNLTDDQLQEFKSVTKPVMEWMKANINPHTKIIIDSESAELLSGFATNSNEKRYTFEERIEHKRRQKGNKTS